MEFTDEIVSLFEFPDGSRDIVIEHKSCTKRIQYLVPTDGAKLSRSEKFKIKPATKDRFITFIMGLELALEDTQNFRQNNKRK